MHFCWFFKCLLFALAKERSVFSVSLDAWFFILMVSQRPFPRELSFVCRKPNLHWRDVYTDLSLEWLLHFLKRKEKLLSETSHICVLHWNVFPFGAFSFIILLAKCSDIPQKRQFHNKHSYTCLDYVINVFLFLSHIYPFCPSLQPHFFFFFFFTNFKVNSRCQYTWECFEKHGMIFLLSCCPGTATSWVPGLRERNLLLNVWFSLVFFPWLSYSCSGPFSVDYFSGFCFRKSLGSQLIS